jgi:hypothetical protein
VHGTGKVYMCVWSVYKTRVSLWERPVCNEIITCVNDVDAPNEILCVSDMVAPRGFTNMCNDGYSITDGIFM